MTSPKAKQQEININKNKNPLSVMNYSDTRILLIMFALFVVSTLLAPGPLRSQIETYLVLSIVPGLLTIISLLELLGSGIDTSSWMFYVRLLWIVSTGYISAVFYSWLKEFLDSKLSIFTSSEN